MRFFSLLCLSASVLASTASNAVGQEAAIAPAHISFVEGSATLERAGEVEPVVLNMPVIEGDRVRTGAGRLQIAFADGSAVDLEQNSEVEYLGGSRIRVYAGTVENRPAVALQSPSAPYLTADSQPYAADLDQNGTWQYDTTYGNVWYPTVAASWRPYYYGYWSNVPAYGWTWIGYNRWAWPTHHYGRWGYAHSRWFWIPGRVYASAWVSWGTAPGYVSWCPLGFNNQPVVGLSVGYSHGWNAWTIVPRDHFGWRGYPTHRYAVEPYRVAASTPFIVHREQPAQNIRGTGSHVAAPSGASSVTRSGSVTARGETGTGTAVPRYSNPSYSRADNAGRPPAAGTFTNRVDGNPSVNTVVTPGMPQRESVGRAIPERESLGRALPRGTAGSAAPAPSYRMSAPSYQPPARSYTPPPSQRPAPTFQSTPPPQMSRRSPERARPSSTPPPSTAPRGNSGGGHMTNGPHADRGPSAGTQNGGAHGSASQGKSSRGGASQGTAVRRPR